MCARRGEQVHAKGLSGRKRRSHQGLGQRSSAGLQRQGRQLWRTPTRGCQRHRQRKGRARRGPRIHADWAQRRRPLGHHWRRRRCQQLRLRRRIRLREHIPRPRFKFPKFLRQIPVPINSKQIWDTKENVSAFDLRELTSDKHIHLHAVNPPNDSALIAYRGRCKLGCQNKTNRAFIDL